MAREAALEIGFLFVVDKAKSERERESEERWYVCIEDLMLYAILWAWVISLLEAKWGKLKARHIRVCCSPGCRTAQRDSKIEEIEALL